MQEHVRDAAAHSRRPDCLHGFNIPGMKLRASIPPGKMTELKLTPTKVVQYVFYCDVFCGSRHEKMNGKITVVESPHPARRSSVLN